MNKDIGTTNDEQSLQITDRLLMDFMKSYNIASQLNENEKLQFISIAKAYQLNPFKREIYCIAYGKGEYRKLNIITGYEVYLKRAERTGKLAGWKVTCEGEGKDLKAIIEIHRIDWKFPLIHEVMFREYSQDNQIWKSKPNTMIKKVAMAQGFRLAFPDELGGMPYDESEFPKADIKFVNESTVNFEQEYLESKKKKDITRDEEIPEAVTKLQDESLINENESVTKCHKLEKAAEEFANIPIETRQIESHIKDKTREEIMHELQDDLDKCTTAQQLSKVARGISKYKDKLKVEDLAALRTLYSDLQDQLVLKKEKN
jgi:phage recombination protein Bet